MDIIGLVRNVGLPPDQLAALIRASAASAVPSPEPGPAPKPSEEVEKPERPNMIGSVVMLLVMVMAGAACYLKFFKKKPDVAGNADLDDYDYGDKDEPEDEAWEEEAPEDGGE